MSVPPLMRALAIPRAIVHVDAALTLTNITHVCEMHT